MASRKRNHDEVDNNLSSEQPSLLSQIRNTWQFACLMQYIQLFGSALRIDNELDVDVLEAECLNPQSDRLAQLGLTMLKWVSSHRGLTLDIFDEYTRRQYLAKAPHLNPFGEEEEAAKFSEFDIFTKLRVLHQLSVWTFNNPDRIRERMEESRDSEQTAWRIEPFGVDKQGRSYYLLDDNRLYRVSQPSQPQSASKASKAKSKSRKTNNRSSKRQKLSNGDTSDRDGTADGASKEASGGNGQDDRVFGGAKWECIAVSIEEFRVVIDMFRKSKDIDEKELAQSIQDDVMPELERAEESKARKEARRMRELENLQRMAGAKRSSRIAGRHEKEKQEAEARAVELKRQQELDMAHKEADRQHRAERDRESRMMTREQRIKDREMRRILHEEELAKLGARSESVESNEVRMSERNRKAMLEKKQKDLDYLKQETEDWDFDCSVCGKHGKNVDDGTHSIACDKCGVWEHCACHKISPEQADKEDFKFVCDRCIKPKSNIKLKLPGQGFSSPSAASNGMEGSTRSNLEPIVMVPRTHHVMSPPMGTFRPPSSSSALPPSSGSSQGHAPTGRAPSQPYSSTQGSPTMMTHHQLTQTPPQATGLSSHRQNDTSAATYRGIGLYPHQLPQDTYYPGSSTNHQRNSSDHQTGHTSGVKSQTNGARSTGIVPNTASKLTNGDLPQFSSTSPQTRPTPSLSATQGNTDVRFSPTAQPTPVSPNRTSSNLLNLANSPGAAQAYSPSSGRPAPGASSPVKHASPPQPSFVKGGISNTSAKLATLGGQSTPRQPAFESPTKSTQSAQSNGITQSPFSQDQARAAALQAPPTLSPSVNVNGLDRSPPVKKPTPTKNVDGFGSPGSSFDKIQLANGQGSYDGVDMQR